MIKPTIANIVGKRSGILGLKRRYDRTLKNIPNEDEDLLMTTWK